MANTPISTEVRTEADLLPPGAAPGTIPTDLEQATGLERLEILGKMHGIDVFDMKPLDASRVGMKPPPRPPPLSPDASKYTTRQSRRSCEVPMTTNHDIYAWLSEFPRGKCCQTYRKNNIRAPSHTHTRSHISTSIRSSLTTHGVHYTGTLDDPIMVKSFGDEQYCGCTGCPADSHNVIWLTVRFLFTSHILLLPLSFLLQYTLKLLNLVLATSFQPEQLLTLYDIDIPRSPRRALPRMRERL